MKLDVCIRGSGIVGRTLALLLAEQRLRVGLVQSPAHNAAPDIRAYAINPRSRALLERIRAWPESALVTPVRAMEVFHEGARVDFSTSSAQDSLNWIVGATALQDQLTKACSFQSTITVLSEPAPAGLTVVCEGKESESRAQWGVEFEREVYSQQAIAARLRLSTAHGNTARQWFNGGHIVALLPLGGDSGEIVEGQDNTPSASEAALVWSAPSGEVQELLALDESAFIARLNSLIQPQSMGVAALGGPRQHWPLSLGHASRWVGAVPNPANNKLMEHFALAGDAAHTIHPLAGQGLNLGLADVADLAKCIEEREYWRAVGDMKVLRRYERMRAGPTLAMARGCDALQALFAHSNPGLQKMRQWGMSSLNQITPLKQGLIRLASQ